MVPRAPGRGDVLSATAGFYEDNAEDFARRTVDVDVSHLRERFLEHVPPGGHILDAGCGSGRDGRAFQDAGYQVTAIDASPALARIASKHVGQEVRVLRFQDVDFESQFDGVWACASLLHVPEAELGEVLRRLARSLVPGGACYMSFKLGEGEREDGGRTFLDVTPDRLAEVVDQVGELVLAQTWLTDDCRPGRDAEKWVNALARREVP
ncbi:class I SAM-dependent methyltransferase [Planctomycetota bacterium]|nr:class I SAM-dependent methyltransferase [Planctomycetota bacterium]